MHAKGTLLRHVKVHDAKDTLLHFSSVRGTKDDELLCGEVNGDRSLIANIRDAFISDEFTSIEDGEVGAGGREVLLDEVELASDEHLLHEEGVIRSGRDDASLDAILLIPAGVTIDNEQLKSGYEQGHVEAD